MNIASINYMNTALSIAAECNKIRVAKALIFFLFNKSGAPIDNFGPYNSLINELKKSINVSLTDEEYKLIGFYIDYFIKKEESLIVESDLSIDYHERDKALINYLDKKALMETTKHFILGNDIKLTYAEFKKDLKAYSSYLVEITELVNVGNIDESELVISKRKLAAAKIVNKYSIFEFSNFEFMSNFERDMLS